ncbi:IclR family transcriptional regulator [Kutzneria chonburiensis]|uniref:IclR family transcriptional regulator n=1 Tax=Kutzneria chonburiensis TaxID=1483604 RepID=A0ABV6N1J3_9PSEU|nr:helix-turn-helix domain-containing protein [Kutzneria chonburiensis]
MDDQRLPRSIGKALMVFAALREGGTPMRLTELSVRTGIAKSTTHRMLCALTSAGLVARAGTHYQPARLDSPTGHRDGLRRLAPFLGDLLVRTGMTASLAVLDGVEVEFVHRVYGHRHIWGPDDADRAPAHGSAAGRLLLAYDESAARTVIRLAELGTPEAAELGGDLMRIRQRGYAELTGSYGNTMLAVPLRLPKPPAVALVVEGSGDRDRALHWLRRVADAALREVCWAA